MTLAARIRANAELLDAMLDNRVRLERRLLDALIEDMLDWAEEIEAKTLGNPRVSLRHHVPVMYKERRPQRASNTRRPSDQRSMGVLSNG